MDKAQVMMASFPASASYRLLFSAASVNATVAKDAAAQLKGIQGENAAATTLYLKLYDKATAPAETDTPVKTLPLPPGSVFSFDFAGGIGFANGLSFRITGAVADNDTTAIAAADVKALNLDYAS